MGSNTFVRADVWTVAQTDQGNVVLVRPKESDVVVPIFIGQLETQSILIGLGHVEMPRPLTHDLLMSVIHAMEADVARVEIRDLRDRTFYANVVIKSLDGEITIDARPSDALALAVRSHAEVYIAEDIVESAGVPVDMIREAPTVDESRVADDTALRADTSTESVPPVIAAERDRLRRELEEAVAAEDYERAAAIRDRLKLL
ncbi:MAG: bifunctional nuclease family protein [Spirochaetales bacterium]|nr:bifunctional nuclease family protein [Spirochaetales bacterium]